MDQYLPISSCFWIYWASFISPLLFICLFHNVFQHDIVGGYKTSPGYPEAWWNRQMQVVIFRVDITLVHFSALWLFRPFSFLQFFSQFSAVLFSIYSAIRIWPYGPVRIFSYKPKNVNCLSTIAIELGFRLAGKAGGFNIPPNHLIPKLKKVSKNLKN